MNLDTLRILLALAISGAFVMTISAQAPAGINYQAVARNAMGSPMANDNLVVRLSIYTGATPTTKIYEEKHEVTTSDLGLFNLVIGKGDVGLGDFTTIDWGSNGHHFQIEIDPGTGYIDLGMTQFLSTPYALYAKEAGNDQDNQMLNLSGNNLSISGGNSVALPMPSSFSLPFSGASNDVNGTTFEVTNSSNANGVAITGRLGGNSSVGGMSRAAIWGTTNSGHALVGFTSAPGAYAGVWGRTNTSAYGVQGTAGSGGTGGFFENNATGGNALITGTGLVGIGTDAPEKLLHVEGDLFVNSAQGGLEIGQPGNGDQWRFSTINGGEDLQLFSKPDGSNTRTRRMFFQQSGRVGIGNTTSPAAQLDVSFNSSVAIPHLRLFEDGSDYARLAFQNTSGTKFWSIAGLNNATTANERLNFYHSATGDIMSITGNGNVGIRNINPTARLHLNQGGQTVGRGFRFSDGTANEDWDITHGFGLRFHYGGDLRGFISANTGAYSQSSDARLKTEVEAMTPVLSNVLQLQPLRYRYKNTPTDSKTIGFIAQNTKGLFPELVDYSEADDLYGINYAGFSVVAVKAIQEQQEIIEQQQQTIDDLQKRLSALEKIVLENQKK